MYLVLEKTYKMGLTGFGDEFFKTSDSTIVEDRRASLQAYKSVLNSKGTEETLVRDGGRTQSHP